MCFLDCFFVDDSTTFVNKGTAQETKWVFFDKTHQSSNKIIFTGNPGGSDYLNGIQAWLTHAMNGLGQLDPIYIIRYGLIERELPSKYNPSGMLYLQIPGLCHVGNMDPRADLIGYVNFISGTNLFH